MKPLTISLTSMGPSELGLATCHVNINAILRLNNVAACCTLFATATCHDDAYQANIAHKHHLKHNLHYAVPLPKFAKQQLRPTSFVKTNEWDILSLCQAVQEAKGRHWTLTLG
jgi:hypothetical protein